MPARSPLLSDVHGNLPAFEAVVADVREAGVDEIWCLGDLVGYGAQPDECVALARRYATASWRATTTSWSPGTSTSATSPRGRRGGRLDAGQHGPEALDFLRVAAPRRRGARDRALPREPARPRLGVRALHLAGRGAAAADGPAGRRDRPLPRGALVPRGRGRRDRRRPGGAGGSEADLSEGRWLLNPGGVGQPRDGDPRAAWLLLDTEAWTATWRRVEYPIDEAAKAIEEAGLPPVLGERLYTGQ